MKLCWICEERGMVTEAVSKLTGLCQPCLRQRVELFEAIAASEAATEAARGGNLRLAANIAVADALGMSPEEVNRQIIARRN
jgi:uncharacterized protein YciW